MSAILTPRPSEYEIVYDFDRVPTVRRFCHDWQHALLGLMGPYKSGKSSGCIAKLIMAAQRQAPDPFDDIRRTRTIITRNTYRQLEDTTIWTFLQWLPPSKFGMWSKTDLIYRVLAFDGIEWEILFRALDRPEHVANLKSNDFSNGWVNEAPEVPWPIIESLQMRVGLYPNRDHGGCTWGGLLLDGNPPDEDSDWYRVFEKEKPSNAKLYRQPPGAISRQDKDGRIEILGPNPKAENVQSIPADYYTAGAIGKSRDFIKVFILGEYGFAHDGMAVFPEYNDATHYRETLGAHPTAVIWRGWDFGVATSACVFAQVLPGPRLVFLGEVIARGIIGIKDFARQVKLYTAEKFPNHKAFKDIGDPTGDNDTAAAEDAASCFKVLRGMGIHIQAGDNALTTRLESIRLGLNTNIGGIPLILVGPGAPTLRKGFLGGYFYRRKRISEVKYEDEPYKNEYSHPMDGAEYIAARILGGALRSSLPHQPDNRPVGVQPDEEIF